MTPMEDRFLQLLRQAREIHTEIAETRGELGSATKGFCDDFEANKTALGFIARLDRMSDEKRDDVLRSFNLLLPMATAKWATSNTPDMFEGQDDDSDEDVGRDMTGDPFDDEQAA